ncbi:hypothetical protein JCM6882_006448 [Rhodosporidiobolus microsporus]
MSSSASYTPLPNYPPSRPPRALDPALNEPDPLLLNCLRLLTRPKSAVALLTGCFLVFLVVYGPQHARSDRDRSLLALGENPDAQFADLWRASQAGWEPYEPPERSPEWAQYGAGQLETWADRLPLACADLLLAEGQLCDDARGSFAREPSVDLLWTWTNGSDPLLRRWRAEVTTSLSGRVKPGKAKVQKKLTARHFREHDELRYSIRSALSAFVPPALRKIHLLTTDLPPNVLLSDLIDGNNITETVESSRIGQVPSWLDRSSAGATPALETPHHSALFEDSLALPTFNSLSIESQFPHLDAAGEFVLYLNDDTFLLDTHNMTAADVGVPFLGPVFRIQTDLTVDGASPSVFAGPPDGEWASLHRANYLLDRRFGRRNRGYLAHIPKTLSMPHLREMSLIWHDELFETSAARFRGQRTEYQLAFLATHFIIEAHREALLHAFFVARSDRDLDDSLSLSERHDMLAELGFEAEETRRGAAASVQVPFPRRSTRARMPHLLRRAGVDEPGATGVAFSSLDGFGMGTIVVEEERPPKEERQLRSTRPPPKHYLRPVVHVDEADEPLDEGEKEKAQQGRTACTLELERCFGSGFLEPLKTVSALEVIRRVAFERPECGDCAIMALVGRSGRSGLSAFLPECDTSSSSDSIAASSPSSLFSSAKTFPSASLPLSTSSSPPTCSSSRALSIRRILRYTYTLGDSKSRFIPMQSARVTEKALDQLVEQQERGEKLPTFLTLNDDFKNDETSRLADPGLRKFFQQQWPDPSPYEKRE